jgi:hypothetical protein
MRRVVPAVLIAVAVLQSIGCCRHCRCCGGRDSCIPTRDARKDGIPPQDVPVTNEGPPRVIPTSGLPKPPNPQPTGAYGGSN